MALIPLDSARTRTLRLCKKIAPPAAVALLSYKKDRGVLVCSGNGQGEYEVREYGFVDQTLVVEWDGLGKLLKKIIKREFPRSRRVRLLKLASSEQLRISQYIR